MKSFVAVLMLLGCVVVISSNDPTEQLQSGDEQSFKDEVQAEAQGNEAIISNHETCKPDIQTVLRELSVKLAEQSVELRYTQSQMSTVEKQLEELKQQNQLAEIRLKASEKQVEELKQENEAQARELGTLQVRSNITENYVRELSRENGYKVAFSASLSATETSTTTGPFSTGVTLKYTNVFLNTGNAYNPNTGIFTAPVRGVYTYRFSITGHGSTSVPVGAWLYKNGRHVVIAYCQQPSHILSTTNGASLLLEVGDVVYVVLYPNSHIYDNVNNYNTFSGQLLFTV